MGFERTSVRGKVCHPKEPVTYQLPGIHIEPKKSELKPWQKQEWCIPPEHDAAFVCQMEEVLEAV
jgi:hypothetical protein